MMTRVEPVGLERTSARQGNRGWCSRWLGVVCFAAVWFLWGVASIRARADVLWRDGFEGPSAQEDWVADRGVWEIGTPTSGPMAAFEGLNVAATVLSGNAPEGVDTIFYRYPSFTVPSAELQPRLRFRHWFDLGADDYGQVAIQVAGTDTWELHDRYSTHSNGLWTRASIDLASYAGRRIRVGFQFHTQLSKETHNRWEVNTPGPGWYIDDVEVVTGPIVFPETEDFEDPGAEDRWRVTHGVWEIGEPTSGPGKAWSGTKVAGTVLGGNYAERVRYDHGWGWAPEILESWLVSPSLLVPSAEEEPRLSLHHWYDFGADDYGQVQVWVEGASAWEPLSTYGGHCSGVWSRTSIGLGKYAGKRVQFGFLFHGQVSKETHNRWEISTPAPGWYLDDVEVVTGPVSFLEVEGFEDPEAADRWFVTGGVWEIGEPSNGPGKAWSGTKLAGTVLGGNYTERVKYDHGWGWAPEILESWLVSPSLLVPSAEEEPRLSLHHWYDFGADDYGQVRVWVEGASSWETLSTCAGHCSGVWSRTSLGLGKYSGKRVQLGFLFHGQVSKETHNRWEIGTPGPGWYLDDVKVVTVPVAFREVEGFEDPEAAERWFVTGGAWEIGEPTSGPGKARSGAKVAGTVLGGNYIERLRYDHAWAWPPEVFESWLISPAILVPPADAEPRLSYQQWYDFGADDYGQVYVWVEGGTQWEQVWSCARHSSGVWSRTEVGLSKYAGKRIQLGFLFHAQVSKETHNRWEVPTPGPGWYVDDVAIKTGPVTFLNPEGFEDPGAGDRWSVSGGVWEIGEPTSGPGKAWSGAKVAGTVLGGNYTERLKYDHAWAWPPEVVESRLVSPAVVVPPAGLEPRLRLRQWYEFGADDYGQLQVWVENGSEWETLVSFSSSSGGAGYSYPLVPLNKYAGKRLWFGFLFHGQVSKESHGRWEVVSAGAGWYLDNVAVVVDDLQSDCGSSLNLTESGQLRCRATSTLRQPIFGLAPGAPEGASIDPVLGLFTWSPAECQGPSTNQITITVTDPDNPTLQPLDYETITVIVEEVNAAPVIGRIAPIPIQANVPVALNASEFAYDPDCPAQKLTFSLDACSPTNAIIHPETGRLEWTPTLEQATQSHTICLRVTDDAGASVTATIPVGAFPVISQFQLDGTHVVLAVDHAIPDETVVLEATFELKDPPALTVWTEVRSFKWQTNTVRLEGVQVGERPREFYRLRFAR